MFSWYKYLIVGLVFSRLGFWSGNLFLIAPFPYLCLLVPCHTAPDMLLHKVVICNENINKCLRIMIIKKVKVTVYKQVLRVF